MNNKYDSSIKDVLQSPRECGTKLFHFAAGCVQYTQLCSACMFVSYSRDFLGLGTVLYRQWLDTTRIGIAESDLLPSVRRNANGNPFLLLFRFFFFVEFPQPHSTRNIYRGSIEYEAWIKGSFYLSAFKVHGSPIPCDLSVYITKRVSKRKH